MLAPKHAHLGLAPLVQGANNLFRYAMGPGKRGLNRLGPHHHHSNVVFATKAVGHVDQALCRGGWVT